MISYTTSLSANFLNSNQSLEHSLSLDHVSLAYCDPYLLCVPGDEEFEPCLGGVGNWNRNCQVFVAE